MDTGRMWDVVDYVDKIIGGIVEVNREMVKEKRGKEKMPRHIRSNFALSRVNDPGYPGQRQAFRWGSHLDGIEKYPLEKE